METGTLHCIPADKKQSGQPGVSISLSEEVEDLVVSLTFVFWDEDECERQLYSKHLCVMLLCSCHMLILDNLDSTIFNGDLCPYTLIVFSCWFLSSSV